MSMIANYRRITPEQLAELQAVAPVLQKISKDASVMHVARLNAEKLLNRSNGNTTATQ